MEDDVKARRRARRVDRPWYEQWSKTETLALVRDGIRRGKMKDQTILGPNGQSAALSDILAFHTRVEKAQP